jgi:hypothetical protein
MHPISQKVDFTPFTSSERLLKTHLSQTKQQSSCESRASKLENLFDVNDTYFCYNYSIKPVVLRAKNMYDFSLFGQYLADLIFFLAFDS